MSPGSESTIAIITCCASTFHVAGDVEDDAYTDGAVAKLGVETLRELAGRDEPFFLAVGFLKPHLPFNAPQKYWELYDPAEIELAANPFPPRGATEYTLTSFGEMRVYSGMPASGPISAIAAQGAPSSAKITAPSPTARPCRGVAWRS